WSHLRHAIVEPGQGETARIFEDAVVSQHIRKIGCQSSAEDNGHCSVTLVIEPALLSRKALVRLPVLRQFRSVMASNRKLGCLSIFLFVALCASLFVNIVLMATAFQRLGGIREAEPIPRFREILLQRGAHATTEKIAVITMRGLISSSIPGSVSDSMVDDLRAALQQARDDNRVKAIVLEIDSPGGEVTASDEIYNAVVKTRATKPVVVYMESLAASGGYYVSCGGRFIMGTYDKFLGIVAKERNLPADLLRNSIADGRILSGKEALQNKLIDGLGELDDAFTKAKQLANTPDAKVVKYGPPFSLARFLR